MEEIFEREIKLLGIQKYEKLKKSHVLVVGLGGVGGYACEMLARCGIGNLTIVDFDVVSRSNINRQIVALNSTVGIFKTTAFEKRLKDINPNINLNIITEKISNDNMDKLLSASYDYVVDAIDMLESKIDLICGCKTRNINIVSAMGAGNRVGIPQYNVCDIYDTSNDGLAKKIRKELRKRNISNLDVVCSSEQSIKLEGQVGSIAYHPSVCGITLAAYVINQLIKE